MAMNHKITSWKYLLYSLFLVLVFACGSDPENPTNKPLAAVDFYSESYGSGADNSMDVFLPEGRSKTSTPILVYIHGGAWNSGDKNEITAFRSLLENSFSGYALISLNYTLYDFSTGDGKFPSQENDIIEAIHYITSKTEEWQISDEIILAGSSAGGHLALLHSYKHPDVGNIKATMALFPPTDLLSLYEYNFLTQQGLELLLNGNPTNQESAYLESSPIYFVTQSSVPTVFFHGTEDVVVPISQSELLKDKLDEKEVPYYYESISGQGHGFELSTYPIVIQKAADFIKSL